MTSAPTLPSRPHRALFLDRDGTLIVHRPYLFRPDEVELLPGVRDALCAARQAGYLLFLFTNQSGVGRGLFAMKDVHAVHRRMLELLDLGTDLFADTCIAPEKPGDASLYRKPSPRFIEECIARFQLDRTQTWMIGDSVSDWKAGANARIRSAAIRSDLTTPESESLRAQLGIRLHDSLSDFVAGLPIAEAW